LVRADSHGQATHPHCLSGIEILARADHSSLSHVVLISRGFAQSLGSVRDSIPMPFYPRFDKPPHRRIGNVEIAELTIGRQNLPACYRFVFGNKLVEYGTISLQTLIEIILPLFTPQPI